MVNKKAI